MTISAQMRADFFLGLYNDPAYADFYIQDYRPHAPSYELFYRSLIEQMGQHIGDNAEVLIHGAGGGYELERLARTFPSWRFTGVDPAQAMIDIAEVQLGTLMGRIDLHHSYIEDAPKQLYDGATSILTLHFLDHEERLAALREIIARLKPGAPLFVFTLCHDDNSPEWQKLEIENHAIALHGFVEGDEVKALRKAVAEHLPPVTITEHLEIMQQAGLRKIEKFHRYSPYHAWLGFAPE